MTTQVFNLCLTTHLDPCESYGVIAFALAKELTRRGHVVNLFTSGKRILTALDEEACRIVNQPVVEAPGALMMGYPTSYGGLQEARYRQGKQVALTMFESSKAPEAWAPLLNQYDHVIVPSHFCAGVMMHSGVTVPVSVIPLGVSSLYAFQERPEGCPLTFLAFMDRGERKGGMVALQAFLRAFGDNENYRLILKGRSAHEAKQLRLTNANIEVIQADMTPIELYQLFLRAHVLVNPHRGEGFGLLPREFAATGGLALTTGWSGTADDLDQWGEALPYRLERARWHGIEQWHDQDLGVWARSDVEDVAGRLRDVAACPPSPDSARRRSEAIRSLYSWPRFTDRFLEVWNGA